MIITYFTDLGIRPSEEITMDQSLIAAVVLSTHLQQINISLANRFLSQQRNTIKYILRLLRKKKIDTSLTIYSLKYFLRTPKRIWMKPRRKGWFAHLLIYRDEDDWFESFKMKKETFKYICEMLRSNLQPKPNPLTKRCSIEVEEQVGICIYYLGCCAELRVIGEVFGYAKSTIWKCVRRLSQAMVNILLLIWIRMPNQDECETSSLFFEIKTGLPQIIAAIDGSHIPMVPPKEGYSDYINRKGWPSLNLQALVDHDLL